MYFRFFKLRLGSKRSADQPKAIYSEVPQQIPPFQGRKDALIAHSIFLPRFYIMRW